jgi:hypothetical protein
VTLLEPWVIIRLVAGAVATLLFAYGAAASVRLLRYAHLDAATEGRLALERQAELASTLVKVGAATQLLAFVLSVLAADRLSGAIRGAMCGYGVVDQNRWGWISVGSTAVTSTAAGVLLQLFALDRRVRGLDLMRPLAVACLAMAPLVALDWGIAGAWLTRLDLTVVSSCCSTTLDEAAREGVAYWHGPRAIAVGGTLAGVAVLVCIALAAWRRERRPTMEQRPEDDGRRQEQSTRLIAVVAGAMALLTAPLAFGAVTLEVAPHVYEVPQHLCPFCLFKADARFIGYPLFGAIFLALMWGLGAAVGAMVCSGEHARQAFPEFAHSRLTRQALAWGFAVVLGALPVAAYALSSPGASLFR